MEENVEEVNVDVEVPAINTSENQARRTARLGFPNALPWNFVFVSLVEGDVSPRYRSSSAILSLPRSRSGGAVQWVATKREPDL